MEAIWVRKPTPQQEALLRKQPTWEHDVETWPAEYDERCETFLVIAGKGSIQLEDGTRVFFQQGGPGHLSAAHKVRLDGGRIHQKTLYL